MPTQLQMRAILRTLKKRKNIRSDQRCGTSHSDGEVSHSDSRRSKTCNLQAYKLRALGNCPTSIRNFGTTDLYSTKLVSRHVLILSITHTINRTLQGELDHHTLESKVSSNEPKRICRINYQGASTAHLPNPNFRSTLLHFDCRYGLSTLFSLRYCEAFACAAFDAFALAAASTLARSPLQQS
jgi:hypothetical protein